LGVPLGCEAYAPGAAHASNSPAWLGAVSAVRAGGVEGGYSVAMADELIGADKAE
jgi:hypothetical protein